ncbi:surface antigen BspA-like [Trichomonas vaginalis G3]|uniref:Surface antigen BspA-like n=1 Tax=Trichomonas vaginalis (strain ATCC PRA-98 / G3) TaxID=412133 RepID=A2FIN9_TRIV3|nr:regulation of response to stimulus [Trichomonas vaginalis G3]EAX95211.1 surface antigen BspA-like [Trichomonas vaginalis G3]KAI5506073.1 regulation of response to stimulus [Trichomonas vaginalis G3]|eukprot:XP_001308141.1 surface antigen BspA-like [Trichomonas vaginalis G3]
MTTLTSLQFAYNCLLSSMPSNCFAGMKFTSLQIPPFVSSITGKAFTSCRFIESIQVDPQNEYFWTDSRAIFSKDNLSIIYIASNSGSSYEISVNVSNAEEGLCVSSQITSVTFMNGLQKIKNNCFAGSNLRNLVIPETVTFIDDHAFYNTQQLTEITLPSRITVIRNYLFARSKLRRITIPNNVTLIEEFSFSNCVDLTEVILPENLKEMAGGVFSDSPNVVLSLPSGSNLIIDQQYLLMDKEKTMILQYFGNTDTIVSIPSTISLIKKGAFQNKNKLVEVRIDGADNNLLVIEDFAFNNCEKLSKFPSLNQVTKIGRFSFNNTKIDNDLAFSQINTISESAFSYSSISSVSFISNGNVDLSNNCFLNCQNLKSLMLQGNGNFTLGSSCFEGCSSLNYVSIPNRVLSLGVSCFMNCGLTSVSFTDNILYQNYIPDLLFKNCRNLNQISIPNVRTIGAESFSNTAIEEILLPDTVESLNTQCFKGCFAMRKLTINPNSKLSNLDYGVFDGCSSFETISDFASKNFCSDNGAMYNNQRTKMIVYPPASKNKFFAFTDRVKYIEKSAFIGCSALQAILIPDGSVVEIGKNAFEGCVNLRHINLPLSVTKIGEDAFKGCEKLICGVIIENKTGSYIDMIRKAGIESRMTSFCKDFTCRVRNQFGTLSNVLFMISVFILM